MTLAAEPTTSRAPTTTTTATTTTTKTPVRPPRFEGHPILGHLTAFRKDRVGVLLDLAKNRPEIVEMTMGIVARRLVAVTSPSIANEILSTKEASFLKAPGLSIFLRPVLGDGLLTSEKEQHQRQRRLLAPAFAPKRIAGYATTMGERTDRFAKKLVEGRAIELSDAMMRLTFEIVGKTLFDAEVVSDADSVGDALTTAMEVAMRQLGSLLPIPPQVPTPANIRYRRAVGKLDAVVYRIIRDRRAQGGDRGDVLSVLLEARDDDGTAMTDRQVRDEAMTLFLAGHETTANALAWTFYLLARNPEIRETLEAELDAVLSEGHDGPPSYEELKKLPYTLAVFKEAMRLYPPAYMLARRNPREVVVAGNIIRKNSITLINVMGIHRRADLFPDPERFDPTRFLGDKEKQLPRCAYMPFGAGPRVCIGNHFAMMEGQLLLATIARRARFMLTSDAPAVLEPLVTLRPKELPARVVLRKPNGSQSSTTATAKA